MVTRQALWKYEHDKAQPTIRVLDKLAEVLGVKAIHLSNEPRFDVEILAYRKRAGLGKREQHRIESTVAIALQERARLQELLGEANGIPVRELRIGSVEAAEDQAASLRRRWDLGTDPIGNLTSTLEEQHIHVISVETEDGFEGISAVARNQAGSVVAAAVVTRAGIAGDRQRLDLAHELGHLVLKPTPAIDEENAAFRFGAAFLAPAVTLRRDVGDVRFHVSLAELQALKLRFGMSMQALARRLRDLDIIDEQQYRFWCIEFSRLGYRKREEPELPPEVPRWFQQNAHRAIAEGLLSVEEGTNMLGKKLEGELPLALQERRAFLKLPMEERSRILAEQAAAMADEYERDQSWRELEGGDVLEYPEPAPEPRRDMDGELRSDIGSGDP